MVDEPVYALAEDIRVRAGLSPEAGNVPNVLGQKVITFLGDFIVKAPSRGFAAQGPSRVGAGVSAVLRSCGLR